MKTELTDEEILEQGTKAVASALGRGGLVRFLQALTPKSGDYTAEKSERDDTETLEEIFARIQARKEAQARGGKVS